MSVTERLDGFQRRHHWAAFPLAVIYKYFDDMGPYRAALIAYYAFVSLFPLLLLASTILGFILRNHPELQQQLLNSGVHQIPVVGSQLNNPREIGGGVKGILVGVLGAIYGGMGVAQVLQHVLNTSWRVPRNERPNPILKRGRSILLLVIGGVATLGTTYLSTFGGGTGLLNVCVQIGSVLINTAALTFVMRYGTTRELGTRDVLPGAVLAALAWQALQRFGVLYVQHVVATSSATNGVFAIVLGLLAFLFLTGNIFVFASEINSVRVDELYPRSLLTPFTDDVLLTRGDRKAYTKQAQAERLKGFQTVDVSFDNPPPED